MTGLWIYAIGMTILFLFTVLFAGAILEEAQEPDLDDPAVDELAKLHTENRRLRRENQVLSARVKSAVEDGFFPIEYKEKL